MSIRGASKEMARLAGRILTSSSARAGLELIGKTPASAQIRLRQPYRPFARKNRPQRQSHDRQNLSQLDELLSIIDLKRHHAPGGEPAISRELMALCNRCLTFSAAGNSSIVATRDRVNGPE